MNISSPALGSELIEVTGAVATRSPSQTNSRSAGYEAETPGLFAAALGLAPSFSAVMPRVFRIAVASSDADISPSARWSGRISSLCEASAWFVASVNACLHCSLSGISTLVEIFLLMGMALLHSAIKSLTENPAATCVNNDPLSRKIPSNMCSAPITLEPLCDAS
jgi:hypothetical protein